MTIVERVGEELARRISRRENAKRAAGVVFGLAAAWATQGPFGSSVLARRCEPRDEDCQCNPPFATFCESISASYCDGISCAGPCTLTTTWYANACWCTKVCGPKKGRRGFYKCCDCDCGGGTYCGCKRFRRVN